MADHIVDANKKVGNPQWDEEGIPMNLLAAAEDAYLWLVYFQLSDFALERCKKELRKFLDEAKGAVSE